MRLYNLLIGFLVLIGFYSLNAYAALNNDPPFILSYPSGNICKSINGFAKSIYSLNHQGNKPIEIKGMATKVYDVSSTGGSITNKISGSINDFYIGCINTKEYPELAERGNNIAVINAVSGNYPISTSQSSQMLETLAAANLNESFSGVFFDIETTKVSLVENRTGFFNTAIKGFNAMQLPVGIYLNPNPLVDMKTSVSNQNNINSTVSALNKNMSAGLGLPSSSYNYYAIPLYGAPEKSIVPRLPSVINAITNNQDYPPVHFKFIVSVQKSNTPDDICSILENLVKPYATNKYFSGLVLYAYSSSNLPTEKQINVINEFIESDYKNCSST